MDTNPTETLETQPSPSDSLDSDRTLDDSSQNSPSPDQTLDDPRNSTSVPAELSLADFTNELSPSRDGTPDRSASVQHVDAESQEEEGGGDSPSVSSPVNTFSAYSSSHWAEPWSTAGVSKPDPLAAASSESELWPLVVHTKPYELPSFDDCSWRDETESKRPVVVAGLSNLGNTCFLNAILQCFTHTVPILQGLLSCNHVPCDRYFDGFCVLCAFRDHIDASLSSPLLSVSPRRFVDNLNYFSSGFRRFQQEDAHEFLQCFLDRLEGCCNNSRKMNDTSSSSSQDDNFVKQNFGGRLVSKLRCCNCYHCSDTYEPLIDLSLEIEDVSTLESALESFTKVEKLEDTDIKFTCEYCKEQVSVEKQLMLEDAPSVAALHLKRFKNDGAFVEKIDKDIDFPLELNLEPYTSSGVQTNHEELKYDLYAVVVHIGYSSTSGHYYCFIRYAPDTWYKFDDSRVTRVREEYVLSQEAYILFYAKQGTPCFSNFFETQNPNLESDTSNTSPKSVLDNVDGVSTSSSNLPDNNNNNNNNHSNNISDVDQTSDASNEIFREAFNGSRNDWFEVTDEAKGDDSQRIYGPLPLCESNSSSGTSFDVEKKIPSAEDNADLTILTPPRSPSPDTHEEETPPGESQKASSCQQQEQAHSRRKSGDETRLQVVENITRFKEITTTSSHEGWTPQRWFTEQEEEEEQEKRPVPSLSR